MKLICMTTLLLSDADILFTYVSFISYIEYDFMMPVYAVLFFSALYFGGAYLGAKEANNFYARFKKRVRSGEIDRLNVRQLEAYMAGETLLLSPTTPPEIKHTFEDECVLSYVAPVETSGAMVTALDLEIWGLNTKERDARKKLSNLRRKQDNGEGEEDTPLKIKKLERDLDENKAESFPTKIKEKEEEQMTVPAEGRTYDKRAPGDQTGLFSEISDWMTVDRKKSARAELESRVRGLMTTRLQQIAKDVKECSKERHKTANDELQKAYLSPSSLFSVQYWKKRTEVHKEKKIARDEEAIAKLLAKRVPAHVEVRLDEVLQQARILVHFTDEDSSHTTDRQKREAKEIAKRTAERARDHLNGSRRGTDLENHTDDPTPMFMVETSGEGERELKVRFKGGEMNVVWASSVEISQSSKRRQLVRERQDYENEIALRRTEAKEMQTMTNQLKAKGKEIADIEEEILKADREARDAAKSQGQASGQRKILEARRDAAERRLRRAKRESDKMNSALDGASYAESAAPDAGGPYLVLCRFDLKPDAATGLDIKPRYGDYWLNRVLCGLVERLWFQKEAHANYILLEELNEKMSNGPDFMRMYLSWCAFVVNVPHSTPFLRLMWFGWHPTIDHMDFAGILNANALYSFTIGTPQLGFALWFTFVTLPSKSTGGSDPLVLFSVIMSSTSLFLSFANICLNFPRQLRMIAEKNAQALRDQNEASRATGATIRALKKERDDDVNKRFELAMRDDLAYKTPSEVLDDVMDVDWNLMVNEVRVTWRQFQTTQIKNKSYELAKVGKDPTYHEAVDELVNPKTRENVIFKKGQIDAYELFKKETSDGDKRMVPTPEQSKKMHDEMRRKIEDTPVEDLGMKTKAPAVQNQGIQVAPASPRFDFREAKAAAPAADSNFDESTDA